MTQFLRNAWYAAATSLEIGREFLARTILDEPILFYRTENGEPVALHDLCPHRFVPLHRGKLIGDDVQCGYHGLRFDCSGKCVDAPFDAKIPRAAKIRRYAVVERYGMAWIYMGNSDDADPSSIPEFDCLIDESRARIAGYTHVNANYELVVDNLADLSHGNFLHGQFLSTDGLDTSKHWVERDGDTIHSKFFFENIPTPPRWKSHIGDLGMVDRWSEIRWDAPSLVLLRSGVTPVGRPREEGAELLATHFVTPETATSSHYFYCNCRDYAVDSAEVDEAVRLWQRIAFGEEDKPMLEAQQIAMRGRIDLMSMRPILLSCDAGAVQIRRTLEARLEAEAASLAPARPQLAEAS